MENEKDFLLNSSAPKVKVDRNLNVIQRLTGNDGGQKNNSAEDMECDGH